MTSHPITRALAVASTAALLAVPLAGCDLATQSEAGRLGSILLAVVNPKGEPHPGLAVALSNGQLGTTDERGQVRFDGLPAGEMVALDFRQPFVVQTSHGLPVRGEMILEDAASVTVPAGEVRLGATVTTEIKVGFCNTVPWAIMGVVTGSDLAPFIAKGSVGKVGPCSCLATATAPLPALACPGTTVFAAGEAPPPQVWTVTADTCLGDGPTCDPPIETATASVVH